MKRKQIMAAATAAFIVYVIGYLLLRSEHIIVHAVVRGHDYTYLEHSVRSGDLGMGGGLAGHYAAISYTPLRIIERSYWYLQNPVGTPLSLAARNQSAE